ncbi:peptidoglycan DD-metalloendopeptidase family protein [Streptomyces sp. A7024]|uniref:Peptidoglycan DD-metalloendopeptidase family protein n=1 Tax=Streptomyces coryli TaxID=1128680 RepID=A0A6G4TTI2_9ACTN|nr:LysM peptidoglycan-binding domain-containing M23 family metallopeptidase [Streptomyces coryli]NGN62301.1 peptidoglycan DD-metalloendopeptidase family protein [Streptomyces coryli]
MPDRKAQGRHRRPRPNTVSRASLKVTAGGAGLALPLIGGAVAHASPGQHTEESSEARTHTRGVPPLPALVARQQAPAAAETAAARTTPRSSKPYVVESGDTLTGIAAEEKVRGGWTALYERNRRTIGSDPDLILPGQKLSVRGGTSAPAKPERAAPEAKPKPKPKPPPKPKPAQDKPDSAAKPQGSGYAAPIAGARVGTGYGVRGSSWSSGYHTGADFPASIGTGVRSVSAGKVVSAGWGGSYGYQVVIRHADGKYSQYAHLSALNVRAGQQVNAGQRIARSGATGNVTGPHLHFEIRTGPGYGSDINPLAYLRSKGVRI